MNYLPKLNPLENYANGGGGSGRSGGGGGGGHGGGGGYGAGEGRGHGGEEYRERGGYRNEIYTYGGGDDGGYINPDYLYYNDVLYTYPMYKYNVDVTSKNDNTYYYTIYLIIILSFILLILTLLLLSKIKK